jgi:uncharacterized membrane-anchored protein YitT (DUF2179 family)
MSQDKHGLKYTVATLIKITIACFVGGFAFYKLTLPVGLIPGGFSGIAAVVELSATRMGVDVFFLKSGILSFILNVPFFIISYKNMNKRFFWFSVYGMVMWSVMLEVVRLTMGSVEITFESSGSANILYAVVSGVVGGTASGYIVRLGYSTGGSELVGALVNKRLPFIKIGTVINAIKVSIIVLYWLVLGTTAELVVLTLLSGFISSYMVNMMVDGLKAAKAYYIISNRPSELSAVILRDLNRSSTLFSGEGQRLHTEQKMLMCIVYNHEVARLRSIVHSVDKSAFMFSTIVKEAYGTGFAEQKAPLRLPQFALYRGAKKIKREVVINPLKSEQAPPDEKEEGGDNDEQEK